jgi:two-component system CheB/CheR fusion protein
MRSDEPADARVVAIGASAGGISALKALFEALPSDLNAAYVVLQHLPPDQPSGFPDVVAKWSSMPVRPAEDGVRPQANCIYIPSPDHVLTIDQGVFRATPANGKLRPGIDTIDAFFESLAKDQGPRAIAVILSGTGMDGCAGATGVRQSGGLVFAQDPLTAMYRNMPLTAIAHNIVNYTLPAGAMPQQLAACLDPSYRDDSEFSDGPAQSLDAIQELVGREAGLDLKGYKPSPIIWRIHQRMELRKVQTFGDYLALLQDSPAELEALAHGIPIHVTEFFRDPEAWDVLSQNVVCPLMRESKPIRAWTTACSTGEEAYSAAMLFSEHARREHDFQVFATDAAPEIVARAGRGVFSARSVQSLSPGRRARFFYAADGAFRVKRQLRERMVFAPQDLLADPPIMGLDLITCRNLLIYLEREASERVLHVLHRSLRMGGFLFLGRGEMLLPKQLGFEPVSSVWHIYRKAAQSSNPAFAISTRVRHTNMTEAHAHRAALAHCDFPSVLIDREFRVLRCYGNVGNILHLPAGEPTDDLLRLAPFGLSAHLELAVRNALACNREMTTDTIPDPETGGFSLSLRVTPMPAEEDTGTSRLLVSFIRPFSGGENVTNPVASADLLSTVSVREWSDAVRTSREELEASREELQALNEELRSSNDQLNASYINLHEANTQLEEKIAELAMQGRVLSSGEVATLFLDAKLKVRWFTPPIGELFPLLPQDVDRPITDFAKHHVPDDFIQEIQNVIGTGQPHECEIRNKDGKWFLRRIRTYFSDDKTTNGVSITFTDVTDRKHTDQALRERELWLAGIREALELALSGQNPDASLARLVSTVTTALGEERTRAAFYLANSEGTELNHVVGMSAEFAEAVKGFGIGPESPACGLATHRREPVIAPDVMEDSAWSEWRWMAAKFGYRGFWSFPLHSIAGKFVGTLAIYSREPRAAEERDLELAGLMTRTAAIIVARHWDSEN